MSNKLTKEFERTHKGYKRVSKYYEDGGCIITWESPIEIGEYFVSVVYVEGVKGGCISASVYYAAPEGNPYSVCNYHTELNIEDIINMRSAVRSALVASLNAVNVQGLYDYQVRAIYDVVARFICVMGK